MGRARGSIWTFACLLALVVAMPSAALAGKNPRVDHGVDRAKLRKKAKRVVEKRNRIDVQRVSSCGPRRTALGRRDWKRWVCKWRARGEYVGQIPYHCAGEAHWRRKKPRWRVDLCVNRLRPRAPLLERPNPHPLFGFNEDWSRHLLLSSPSHARAVLARLHATGANVARSNLIWRAVEPSRTGERRWAGYDALNAQFESIGVRPLWVVMGAPCWARVGCDDHPAAPPSAANVDEFARFAAAVARRYPNSVGIEIWNEPNYPRFWGGQTPNPDLYGAMVREAAAAIHAAVPWMKVVTAGLSPHGDNSPSAFGYREYLARLYAVGAAQAADAIGIHPYPSVGPGDDYVSDARVQIGRMLGEMAAAGDWTPLWVTEVGISTTGRRPFPPGHQAYALAQLYELFRHIHRIDVAVIHRLIDDPALGGREAGFGILRTSLAPTEALCSIAVARSVTSC